MLIVAEQPTTAFCSRVGTIRLLLARARHTAAPTRRLIRPADPTAAASKPRKTRWVPEGSPHATRGSSKSIPPANPIRPLDVENRRRRLTDRELRSTWSPPRSRRKRPVTRPAGPVQPGRPPFSERAPCICSSYTTSDELRLRRTSCSTNPVREYSRAIAKNRMHASALVAH